MLRDSKTWMFVMPFCSLGEVTILSGVVRENNAVCPLFKHLQPFHCYCPYFDFSPMLFFLKRTRAEMCDVTEPKLEMPHVDGQLGSDKGHLCRTYSQMHFPLRFVLLS